MKRIIAFILVIGAIISVACPVYAAQPRYSNANEINVSLSINSVGEAEVSVRVSGTTQLIKAEVSVYLERKLGSTWTRVNIGTTDDVWEHTTTGNVMAQIFTTELGRTGTYRAVATFRLTGATIETITKTATDTY